MSIVTKYTDRYIYNLLTYCNIINIMYVFSDGRLLSEPFMKLPPRKDYPDYYEIIKKPIDINKVLNRIEDGKV